MLDEGVVESARAVDTCLLLGAGFPFFLGGITATSTRRSLGESCRRGPLRRWEWL